MGEIHPPAPMVPIQFEPWMEIETGTISALRTAYRTGLQQPRPNEPDTWKVGWQKEVATRSWGKDRAPRAYCVHYLGLARASAARGESDTACRFFGEARRWSQDSRLSDEGRLRCNMELAAAEAYFDYFCGDYEQATARLVQAMSAAEQLEDEFGYPAFHGQRIHLANNMVKVEARARGLHAAMALASSVFMYLQKRIDALPLPGNWGPVYVRHLSTDALRFLNCQLGGEVAAAMAGLPPVSVRDNFELLLSRVNAHEADNSWHPEVLHWLQLKSLWIDSENRRREYLAACIEYFSRGAGAASLFWNLSVIDLVHVCSTFHGVEAALFEKEAVENLLQVKYFPRHVKAVIGRMAAEFLRPLRQPPMPLERFDHQIG